VGSWKRWAIRRVVSQYKDLRLALGIVLDLERVWCWAWMSRIVFAVLVENFAEDALANRGWTNRRACVRYEGGSMIEGACRALKN